SVVVSLGGEAFSTTHAAWGRNPEQMQQQACVQFWREFVDGTLVPAVETQPAQVPSAIIEELTPKKKEKEPLLTEQGRHVPAILEDLRRYYGWHMKQTLSTASYPSVGTVCTVTLRLHGQGLAGSIEVQASGKNGREARSNAIKQLLER